MAKGDLISKVFLDTSTIYDTGTTDPSTSEWSYAFGNSIHWRSYCHQSSNIYVPHPAMAIQLWRYSISGQAWVQVHSTTYGSASGARGAVYRIRCDKVPESPFIEAVYNGDDSYLFAFFCYVYQGARSDCDERLRVFNVGADTTYDNSVKGKKVYARNYDYAYKYHYQSGSADDPPPLTLSEDWLQTDDMAGVKITSVHVPRMVSVKSALAFT